MEPTDWIFLLRPWSSLNFMQTVSALLSTGRCLMLDLVALILQLLNHLIWRNCKHRLDVESTLLFHLSCLSFPYVNLFYNKSVSWTYWYFIRFRFSNIAKGDRISTNVTIFIKQQTTLFLQNNSETYIETVFVLVFIVTCTVTATPVAINYFVCGKMKLFKKVWQTFKILLYSSLSK